MKQRDAKADAIRAAEERVICAAEEWDEEEGKGAAGEGEYRPYLSQVLAEKLSQELGNLRALRAVAARAGVTR